MIIVLISLLLLSPSLSVKWEEYEPNAYLIGAGVPPVNASKLPVSFNIVQQEEYIMSNYTLDDWDKGYKGYYKECYATERYVVPIPVPRELNGDKYQFWMSVMKKNTVYRQPEQRDELVTQEGGKVVFITGKIHDNCDGPEIFIPLQEMSYDDAQHYFA